MRRVKFFQDDQTPLLKPEEGEESEEYSEVQEGQPAGRRGLDTQNEERMLGRMTGILMFVMIAIAAGVILENVAMVSYRMSVGDLFKTWHGSGVWPQALLGIASLFAMTYGALANVKIASRPISLVFSIIYTLSLVNALVILIYDLIKTCNVSDTYCYNPAGGKSWNWILWASSTGISLVLMIVYFAIYQYIYRVSTIIIDHGKHQKRISGFLNDCF